MGTIIFPSEKETSNPYPFFSKMRNETPVSYDPDKDIWAVYRYDDVRRVLGEHETFSSDISKYPQLNSFARRKSLISMDPPEHKHSRDLLTKAFTPRSVANMEPRIAEIANTLLDQVAGKGEMDFIDDFASPLPIIVIAEMLGVPPQDRDKFRSWADNLISSAGNAIVDDVINKKLREQVQDEMDAYFGDIIQQRERNPKDDLITNLVKAEINGEKLSQEQILSFCNLLLIAGHVTTVNLLGNSIYCFTEFTDQLSKLYAEPKLIPSAIEEALRYKSPVQVFLRIAAKDTEIDGNKITEGQRILAWIGSANRDEARFDNPDRFDVTRNPNPHIAFGFGNHFCLGAPLARLEGKVALEIILSRLSNLSRMPGKLVPSGGIFLHGVKSLPIQFAPN